MPSTNLDLRIRANDELRAGLSKATNQVERFTRSAKSRFGAVRSEVKKLRGAVNGFIAALAIRKAAQFTKSIVDQADSIGKLSTRLGLSTEFLSEFRFVAEKTGVDANTLDLSLQRVTRRFGEIARTGRGTALPALQELGSDLVMAVKAGADFEELLPVIATRLAAVQSPAKRLSIAFQLFDSEGAKLVQTLELGADGIARAREEAVKFGASISGEQAKQAAEFNDRIVELTASFKSLAREAILPAVEPTSKFLKALLANTDTLSILVDREITLATKIGVLASVRAKTQRDLGAAIAAGLTPSGGPPAAPPRNSVREFFESQQQLTFTGGLESARDAGESLLFNIKEVGREFEGLGQRAAEFFGMVVEGTQEWSAATDEVIDSSKRLSDVQTGVNLGLQEIVESYSTINIAAGLVVDTATIIGSTLSSSISSFIEGTKSAKEASRDFAKSVIRDLQRIIIQALIARALGALAGGAGGGGDLTGENTFTQDQLTSNTSGPFALLHDGGVVQPGRTVPAILHGGRSGEAVIPLERFSPETVGGGGGLTQNFFIQALDVKSIDDVVGGSLRRQQSEVTGIVENNRRNSTRFAAARSN